VLHINTSTTINQPVDKVFEFVADGWFTNLRVWNHELIEIHKTSDGPVGTGTTGNESQTIQGKPYSRSFIFEDYQPNKGFAIRSLEPKSKETYYCTFQFEPLGNATRLVTMFNFEWPTLMFKVLKPIIRSMIKKSLDQNYGTYLKEALER
jgi:Polyketide cyclase / dehydrase and lipid transport